MAEQILGEDLPAPNVAVPTDYLSWINSFSATEGPGAAPYYQAAADNYIDFDGDVDVWAPDSSGDAQLLSSNLGTRLDLALEQAVMEEQDVVAPLPATLDLQYEFESVRSKRAKSKDVEAAVDMLLAVGLV